MPSNVSVGARTGFEQFVLDEQKKLGHTITPQEYQQLVQRYFGDIPLPNGAKEVSRTPTELIYTLNGKEYRAYRNTNSDLGNVDIGRIETTQQGNPIGQQSAAGELDLLKQLMPSVGTFIQQQFDRANQNPQQATGAQSWLDALFQNAQKLQQQPTLGVLSPQDQAALEAIKQAQLQQLQKQFGEQAGQLEANLFGRGINRSTVAGTQGGQLLGQQGLVLNQALSDAAQRELALKQFLTQLGQGNLALAGDQFGTGANAAINSFRELSNASGTGLNFLSQILGQQLQREIAGTGLEQDQQRINLQREQFDKNYGLAYLQNELQDQQRRHQNNVSFWNSILNGALSLGTGLATGGLSSLFSGIFNSRGIAGAPPVGGDGGYG